MRKIIENLTKWYSDKSRLGQYFSIFTPVFLTDSRVHINITVFIAYIFSAPHPWGVHYWVL